MTVAVRTGLRQGTPEWLDARRSLVTATDLPVLLGISPYKCEADLADEKLSGATQAPTIRMKVGTALEELIAEEYTAKTGRRLQRIRDLVIHPKLDWAGASPDRRVIGEQRAVELKWTNSRSRFADGLPQDVEAQVMWSLGVLGWPVADVAVLAGDELLPPFEVPFDAATFDNLVTVAQDFRRRLADGGPFARNLERIRRDHPRDDGNTLVADPELNAAASALFDVRASIERLEETEKRLKTAIEDRMGDAAVLEGDGWHATWKRSKDREETDWRSLADGLLRQLPPAEREALIGIHTNVTPGYRPFRLVREKD